MRVLDCNEEAYRRRYSASLQERVERLRETGGLTEETIAGYRDDLAHRERTQPAYHIDLDGYLLIIVVGFADGRFLEDLLQRASQQTEVIVFEPDEALFLYTVSRRDVSSLLEDKRLTLVAYREDAPEEIFNILRYQVTIANVQHMGRLVVPGYEEAYGGVLQVMDEELERIVGNARQAWRFWRDMGNLPKKNELYAMSALADSSVLSDLVRAIPTRDAPVIIVAAGPSLNKNAQNLRFAEGRALIVAVAHAVQRLLQMGIMPDLVASADPRIGAKFLDDNVGTYKLPVDVQADRPLQEKFCGRCIYHSFTPGLVPFSFLPEQPILFSQGESVATQVFSLFRMIGFRKVILVGQDLAYNEAGESHAGGEREESSKVIGGVEGIHGERLDTRADWLIFLQYYEREIAAHPEMRVIDATEGGARIRGTELMTLREAIQRECVEEYPVDAWLKDLPKAQTRQEQEKLRGEMLQYVGLLSICESQIGEAITLNERIARGNGADGLLEQRHRYDVLYEEIVNGKAGSFLEFFCEDVMREYMSNAVLYEQQGDETGKLRAEKKLFEGMCREIRPLQQYLREVFG